MNGKENEALLVDLERELVNCVRLLHVTGGLDEPSCAPLISVLRDARAAYVGQDWLPKDLVRVLVDVYPRLQAAAEGADFISQVSRIETSIAAVAATEGPGSGKLSRLSRELADAAADIYLPIRMLDGLDSRAVDKFATLVEDASVEVQKLSSIPRVMADVFISTYSTIDVQRRSRYYDEAESKAMLDAATSILNMVRSCLR